MRFSNLNMAVAVYQRQHNVTQKDFASQMGMSEATFRRKLTGEQCFSLAETITLADITGFSLDQLSDRAPLVINPNIA